MSLDVTAAVPLECAHVYHAEYEYVLVRNSLYWIATNRMLSCLSLFAQGVIDILLRCDCTKKKRRFECLGLNMGGRLEQQRRQGEGTWLLDRNGWQGRMLAIGQKSMATGGSKNRGVNLFLMLGMGISGFVFDLDCGLLW